MTALVILAAACSNAPDPGIEFGGVRCASDRSGEVGVYDYAAGAQGYETIAEAVAAWKREETWNLRPDWQGLTMGDTASSPVEFIDGRGWVYLSLELQSMSGGWLVTGHTTCSPPD